MDSRLEVIKQRMIDAGISSEEVDALVEPLASELERRVCGLVWKHEGATTKLVDEMEGKLPVLKPVKDKNIIQDENGINHILIEGENLLTLIAMQYTHIDESRKGMVDVIYIDPPYNTETTTLAYNDKFERSEWLSMMNIRLKLAYNLLSDNGVIFMSIDDHYEAELKLLCDDIFGISNIQGVIHWRRRNNQPNDKTKMIGVVAETILVYSKNRVKLKEYGIGKVPLTGSFSNPDNDPRGEWASKPWKTGTDQGGSRYKITTPTGKVINDEWMGSEDTFRELLSDGRIYFPNNGDGAPRKKYYKYEREEEGQCANNWWEWKEFGCNQDASTELEKIMGRKGSFKNPKPVSLIKAIIKLGCISKSATVLDFYAGTGTTLQAVMELNNADNGSRQCIVCTNNELGIEAKKKAANDGISEDMIEYEEYGVCHAVTYPRLKTVITGERMDSTKYSDGIAGNNLYYYQISDGITESPIPKITKDALAKQAVSYIALKENIFNVNEQKDYHILYNADTEIIVIIDPDRDYRDVQDNIVSQAFTKSNRKVYCSLRRRTIVNSIEYIPYPEEVLDVLKSVKKRVRKESKR